MNTTGLSDVTILVTSFLRPGYVSACLTGIARNLPECKVITVDDSEHLENLRGPLIHGDEREIVIRMDFDSGLSAKRNAGVRTCKTKYLLLGCDDFDFSTKEARDGILRMLCVLDCVSPYMETQIDVAGGRVDGRKYEGFLEYVPGEYIKETPLDPERFTTPDFAWMWCDITVNYFLARTEVLRQVPWDKDIKPIGGEHGQFFLDLKEAGRKVVWVKGVNITTLRLGPEAQHPDYGEYRARAVTHGHRIFMEKRNIKEYRGF